MAGRQVTYTKRNIAELVNKVDPKRLSEPVPIYPLSNGKIKTQLPDLPGQDYRWTRDIEDV